MTGSEASWFAGTGKAGIGETLGTMGEKAAYAHMRTQKKSAGAMSRDHIETMNRLSYDELPQLLPEFAAHLSHRGVLTAKRNAAAAAKTAHQVANELSGQFDHHLNALDGVAKHFGLDMPHSPREWASLPHDQLRANVQSMYNRLDGLQSARASDAFSYDETKQHLMTVPELHKTLKLYQEKAKAATHAESDLRRMGWATRTRAQAFMANNFSKNTRKTLMGLTTPALIAGSFAIIPVIDGVGNWLSAKKKQTKNSNNGNVVIKAGGQ